MTGRNRGSFLFRRIVLQTLGVLALLIVGGTCYLVIFGVPDSLVGRVMASVRMGDLVVESSAVKLHPSVGIQLDGVRVYKKGVVGPPAIEADRLFLSLDPVALVHGTVSLRTLRLKGAVVRPSALRGHRDRLRESSPMYVDLRVALESCRVDGFELEEGSFRFHSGPEGIRIEDIIVVPENAGPGSDVRGLLCYDSDSRVLNTQLAINCDPNRILPVLSALRIRAVEVLIERMDFKSVMPRIELDLSHTFKPGGPLLADCRLWMQDSTYRGVDVLRADGRVLVDLSATNRTVTVDPLLIVRQEGMARGDFTVDILPERRTVTFDAFSTMHPDALLRIIGVVTNDFFTKCRVEEPFSVTAKGVAGYEDKAKNDFDAEIQCGGIGNQSLLIRNSDFVMKMRGPTNVIENLRGRFCDGEFTGRLSTVLPYGSETNTRFTAEGTVRNADFQELSNLLSDKQQEYDGRISGEFAIEGLMGTNNLNTVRGTCAIRIKHGRIFMLPIFGELSAFIAGIIPGLDVVLRQSDAKAEFVIVDARAYSDKVLIEGDVISLSGSGYYAFNGDLDFDVRISLLKSHTFLGKVIRIPTYLVSKLFQFRLSGSRSDPHWYPVNFSKDLWDRRRKK